MSITTKYVLAAGVGNSMALRLAGVKDPRAALMCIVTGTVNYDLQYSLNGQDWMVLKSNAGRTASIDDTIVFPIHSLRVKVNSGAGSVKLILRQDDQGYGV